MRLFCFPYAGGGVSAFHFLLEQAPSDIEICPIQLPGREGRFTETPFTELDVLVKSLYQALLPYFDGAYAFFGHSMGALISFELTRLIRLKGQVAGPVHLFVSGHRAPHLPDPRPPVHHLSDLQLIETLRQLNGTPEAVLNNSELLQLLLPLLRADFTLCETYAYRSELPLTCPISAFGGLDDSEVSREAIMAWREQTQGSFQARFFMGDHFYLHKEQANLLAAILAGLQSTSRDL
ncbi:thioesterase [Ktedonobacter robiniae]|uniref:Thioesterase n=1 Tax=Ktedonobacter robiniae TaxID=2778365 RepID=A0ABQ3UYS7_9CHLR|nr:thioesterase [Ktedonobacter robiniae]